MQGLVAATLTSSQLHWIVRVTVGVCIALGVSAASHHFRAGGSANPVGRALRLVEPQGEPETLDPKIDPSLILGAGLFCQGCAPVEAKPTATRTATAGLPESSLPLTLLATAEARDPADSMATIIDRETHAVSAYGVGDELRAGVKVSVIERGRVLLEHHERSEYLVIRVGKDARPPAVQPRQTPGTALDTGFDCRGSGACQLSRSQLRDWVREPGALAQQARIVPLKRHGELEGFRVFAIRPNSIPARLGLRNGDTVVGINGVALDDLDAVMGLYAGLEHTSRLEVQLERRGETLQRVVELH